MKLEINSAQEMQKLGASLGRVAKPGSLLLLNGDLGAGKTTMTQGLARSLGIRRPAKSPTFTIVREYREGRLPLFHIDMHRLENDDLVSIDLNGYLNEQGIVVIEWPETIMDDLPDDYLQLTLKRVDDSWDSTKRAIEVNAQGKQAEGWPEDTLAKFEE